MKLKTLGISLGVVALVGLNAYAIANYSETAVIRPSIALTAVSDLIAASVITCVIVYKCRVQIGNALSFIAKPALGLAGAAFVGAHYYGYYNIGSEYNAIKYIVSAIEIATIAGLGYKFKTQIAGALVTTAKDAPHVAGGIALLGIHYSALTCTNFVVATAAVLMADAIAALDYKYSFHANATVQKVGKIALGIACVLAAIGVVYKSYESGVVNFKTNSDLTYNIGINLNPIYNYFSNAKISLSADSVVNTVYLPIDIASKFVMSGCKCLTSSFMQVNFQKNQLNIDFSGLINVTNYIFNNTTYFASKIIESATASLVEQYKNFS